MRVGVGIVARCGPCRCGGGVFVEVGRAGVDEEVAGIDNTLCVWVGASCGSLWSGVGMLGIGDGVDAVSVIKWLSTEDIV